MTDHFALKAVASLFVLLCLLESNRAAGGDDPAKPQLAPPSARAIAETPKNRSYIRTLLDLPYKPGCKSCRLDLALPNESRPGPFPVIVVIHGGGWIEGDKSSFASDRFGVPGNIVDFARLGFAAATINYRLAGEAPYPAALDDCRAAVRWLREHAIAYQLDAKRIGAYGNSAGGHLALLLALVEDPADRGKPLEQSSRVQAAASDSGPLDLIDQYRQGALRTVVGRFMGGTPEGTRQATYQQASPSHYIAAKGAPLLLIYGEADGQVDVKTADRFVAALSEAGRQDVTYLRLAHVDHCPHSLQRIPYLTDAVDQFFLRTLPPR
ncbi:MAG TPA: alpha/beta hydrolase [Planctomycetaceae bacterium]|jgi:acetyl esterase/lipase|nr:alpha/beta hydrolase [Planctomycetaceae bacterium]